MIRLFFKRSKRSVAPALDIGKRHTEADAAVRFQNGNFPCFLYVFIRMNLFRAPGLCINKNGWNIFRIHPHDRIGSGLLRYFRLQVHLPAGGRKKGVELTALLPQCNLMSRHADITFSRICLRYRICSRFHPVFQLGLRIETDRIEQNQKKAEQNPSSVFHSHRLLLRSYHSSETHQKIFRLILTQISSSSL